MRISTLSKLVAAALLLGLSLSIGAGWYAVQQLKVNGPLYDRIVQGKDLVADILPPPAYIIEAYLEASLVRQETSTHAARFARLKELKKDYFDRHAFWKTQKLKPELQDAMLERAHRQVVAFWEILEGPYARAIETADKAAAEKAWAEITQRYAQHREGIDMAVKLANELNQTLEAEAARLDQGLAYVVAISALGSFALIGICLFGLRARLVQPLLELQAMMTELSRGNLNITCRQTDRRDEIGAMLSAVQVFLGAAREQKRLEEEAQIRRAEIERERKMREQEKLAADQRQIEALKYMADQVEQAARNSVAVVVEEMDAMTDLMLSLSTSASTLRDDSDSVASAAEQTLATMQETTRSTASLNATIRAVVSKVDVAADANQGAVEAARVATVRIQSLAAAITKIEGFTQTINDIARNTNLLALNAGVEAARSGEHGRGFAVIAQEVKMLSEQTARATSEISKLIGDIIAAKDGALGAVREIDVATEKAKATSNDIGDALKAQVTTVDGIASSIVETENAASDVATKIQRVAGETQVTGERSENAQAICTSVSDKILDLQSDLIHSLRTSSEYVNRRCEPRLEVRQTVFVETAQGDAEVELINISSRGALLATSLGEAGARITISLAGLAESVTANVLRSNASTTSVVFDHQIAVKSLSLWRQAA